MTQMEFQNITQIVLACEFLAKPVCFLLLWNVFFPSSRKRRDFATAAVFFFLHVIWWFTEFQVSLKIVLAVLILLYCHIRYRRFYGRAVFLILLYQHLWAFSLLLSMCGQECLDSHIIERVADPEQFYVGIEPLIYAAFARTRVLSGAVFLLALLFLSVVIVKVVKRPFDPGWQDTVFLSVFNVVSYLFIKMTIEISNVKIDREVFSLFTHRRDWLYKAPLMGVLLYVGELSAIGIWQRLKALQEERQQHFVREQQVEAIQKRLDDTEAFYDSIRSVHHEMRNHLANLRGLAANREYGELEAYVNELEGAFEEPGRHYSTGNAVTDVILNDRYQKAARAGISFQADFAWSGSDTIPVFDLGIVLGNLLDNALEACERIDQTKRYVKVSLRRKEPFLLLRVENSCDKKVVFQEGEMLPQSSKKMSVSGSYVEHGLGLKNVQKIAERYLGGIKIRAADGVFQVTVMLQQGQEALK